MNKNIIGLTLEERESLLSRDSCAVQNFFEIIVNKIVNKKIKDKFNIKGKEKNMK